MEGLFLRVVGLSLACSALLLPLLLCAGRLQSRYTAPELLGRLAHLAGLIPEPAPITAQQLIPLFSWEKLPREDLKVEKF